MESCSRFFHTGRLFYSNTNTLIYTSVLYICMNNQLNRISIIKISLAIEKELEKYQSLKNPQVIYDKSTKSFIVKTQNKFIAITIINEIAYKFMTDLTSMIVNDQGFLNFSLTLRGVQ